MKHVQQERCPQCGLLHYECVCLDVYGLPRGEYLITGRRPTRVESEVRGATLVPSMLEEGAMVWRVPAERIGP